jgi:diguanylate cyclase (GGDEF)-like protein
LRLRFGPSLDDDPDYRAMQAQMRRVRERQAADTYEPPERIDFGQPSSEQLSRAARIEEDADYRAAVEEARSRRAAAADDQRFRREQLGREEGFARDEAQRTIDAGKAEREAENVFERDQKARERAHVDLEGAPFKSPSDVDAERFSAARKERHSAAAARQAGEGRAVTAYQKATKIGSDYANVIARQAAAAVAQEQGWDEDARKAITPTYARILAQGQAVVTPSGRVFRAGKSTEEVSEAVNRAYAGEGTPEEGAAREALGFGPRQTIGRSRQPVQPRPGIKVPNQERMTGPQRQLAGPPDKDLVAVFRSMGHDPAMAEVAAQNFQRGIRTQRQDRERGYDEAQRRLDERSTAKEIAQQVAGTVGDAISMPMRGIGMLAEVARSGGFEGFDEDRRVDPLARMRLEPGAGQPSELMGIHSPGWVRAATGADVIAPNAAEVTEQGYKGLVQAVGGPLDARNPGALGTEAPIPRGRVEALVKPVADLAFQVGADPSLAGMLALQGAGKVGRLVEATLGGSFVPGMTEAAVTAGANAVESARARGITDPETLHQIATAVSQTTMAAIATRGSLQAVARRPPAPPAAPAGGRGGEPPLGAEPPTLAPEELGLSEVAQEAAPEAMQTSQAPRGAAPRAAPEPEVIPARGPAGEAPGPTPGQMEAGNYKKGHVRVEGLDISIETPRGGVRTAKDGSWRVEDFPADYGYIRRSKGADGDHVDVFVGDAAGSGRVFVIDQLDAETGRFDEHKVMVGFPDEQAAVGTYRRGFSDGRADERIGAVTPMTTEQFKGWLKGGDTTQPISRQTAAAAFEGRGGERRQGGQPVGLERRIADRRAQIAAEVGLPEEHPAVQRAAKAEVDARTDRLTGIGNKAVWEEIQASLDPSADHALVMDLKRFKPINDTYGHDAGDTVLRTVADVLTRHLGDDAARFGGDEFGGALRGMTPEQAQAKAAAIQHELSQTTVELVAPDGSRVAIPAIESHIGVGRSAHEADLATNAAAAESRRGGRGDLGAVPAREPGSQPAAPGAPREGLSDLQDPGAEPGAARREDLLRPERRPEEDVTDAEAEAYLQASLPRLDRGELKGSPQSTGRAPRAKTELGLDVPELKGYGAVRLGKAIRADGDNPVYLAAKEAAKKAVVESRAMEEEFNFERQRVPSDAIEPEGPVDTSFDPEMFESAPPPRGPDQRAMFPGRDMLQGVERRVTEGREADGPLFTQEADARARAESQAQRTLTDLLNRPARTNDIGGAAAHGAEVVRALAAVAVERGLQLAHRFAEWAPQMVQQFGDRIRPYLRQAWEQARYQLSRARNVLAPESALPGGREAGVFMIGGKNTAPPPPPGSISIPSGGGQQFAGRLQAAKKALDPYLRGARPWLEEVAKIKSASGQEPVGQALAGMVKRYQQLHEGTASRDFATFRRGTDGLTKAQEAEVVAVLDGQMQGGAASPEARQAATKVRAILDDVATRARDAGVLVARLGDYFPHRFAERWSFEQEAQHHAEKLFKQDPQKYKNPATDPEGALDDAAADLARQRDVLSYNRPDAHLEKQRNQQNPQAGYRTDLGVIGEYLLEANRRIAEARTFGPKLEGARRLINRMERETRLGVPSPEYALRGIKRLTGREQRDFLHVASDEVRKFHAVTKLAFSAPNQLGSIANTVAAAGFGPTIKAMLEVGRPGSKAYKEAQFNAIENGALFTNIGNEIRSTWGAGEGPPKGIEKLGVGRWALRHLWGIPYLDAYQRVIAATAAKHAIPGMVKAGDTRGLEKMKLGPGAAQKLAQALESGAPLSPENQERLNRASKQLSDNTQYRTGITDLPLWSTSPGGRALTQFMPFMYQHGRMVHGLIRQAYGEVKGGRVTGPGIKALAAYVGAAAVAGEAAASIKSILQGYGAAGEPLDESSWKESLLGLFGNRRIMADLERPESLLHRGLQNFLFAGGFGIWQSFLERFVRARSVADLGGPTAGDATKLVKAGVSAAGGDFAPGVRAITEAIVPGFGSQLTREFMRDPKAERASPTYWPGWVGRVKDFALEGETTLGQTLGGGTGLMSNEESLGPTRTAKRDLVMAQRERRTLESDPDYRAAVEDARRRKQRPRTERQEFEERARKQREATERARRKYR